MTQTARYGKVRTEQGLTTLKWSALGSVLLAIASLGLWLISIQDINLSRLNDLGLVSVLPPWTYIAFIGLTISFCFTLAQRQPSEALLGVFVLILVFMLYGMTPFIEDISRFGSAWKHVGVIDLIMRTGSVNPELDAYNNWPGFFILGALFTKVSGLPNAIPFLAWAPVFFNLIYLLPLRAIMLTMTDDRRLVWLGMWFFNLANWVGQDYFSPQAMGYFFFMVILAILLTWFVAPGQPPLLARLSQGRSLLSRMARYLQNLLGRAKQDSADSQPQTRVALLLIMVSAFVVMVASHQLTPFGILGAVILLALFNRLKTPRLHLIFGLILTMWITYMTVAYLKGHIGAMIGFFGQLGETVDTNLTSRVSGSPQHMVITFMRLFSALWLWGLAFLGGLRRFDNKHFDLNHILLAVAPFPLIALQSYGGELLMRIYLFALPLMAAFAAALFFPVKSWRPAGRTALLIGVTSLVWLVLFIFIRFGNERMDYFTIQENQAVQYLYQNAPHGSLLVASSTNMPFRYKDYELYKHVFLSDLIREQDIPGILDELESRDNPNTYLILTRSQSAYLEIFFDFPHDGWQKLKDGLFATGKFDIVFSNPDGIVYKLKPQE